MKLKCSWTTGEMAPPVLRTPAENSQMTGETTVHVTQKKTAAVPAVAAIKEEDIVLLRQWLCKMEAYGWAMGHL
ncbi:hypothetical protein T265_12202 [Opisthorchis viverrini]|uniref:Uncharacterized protein n=1 Tax=Opisthorchis viverrini TaxID=6198 RepID=A0A074YV92_OPIVI|nr:hypothetical protein T265_12202 [Opisthorchis viverrini]KER18651.1 hypothetical protein T265_12202 [Opisthorchis viverrini]